MKKGSFYSAIMVFGILLAIGAAAIAVNTLKVEDEFGDSRHIGDYQSAQVSAIQEGENALLYLDQAAKYATRTALVNYNDGGRTISRAIDGADAPEFVESTECGEFVYTKWSTLSEFCPPQTPEETYKEFLEIDIASYLSKGPYDIPAGNHEIYLVKDNEEYYVEGIAKEPIVIDIVTESNVEEFGGSFDWPLEQPVITSCFGERNLGDGWHDGLDFRKTGEGRLKAIADGVVEDVCRKQECSLFEDNCENKCGDYGNYIVIKHSGDIYSRYAHMEFGSVLPYEKRDEIAKGAVIGKVGNTGKSKGDHLHFSMYQETWFGLNRGKNPMCFYDDELLSKLESAENAGNCPSIYRKESFSEHCDEINFEKINSKLEEDGKYEKKKIGEYKVMPHFKVKTDFVLPSYDNDMQEVIDWAEETWETCQESPEACLLDRVNLFNTENNEYSLTTESCEEYWFYNRIIETFERCLEIDATEHICKVDLTEVPRSRYSRLGTHKVRLEGYEIIMEEPEEKKYFLGERMGYYSIRPDNPNDPGTIELMYQNGNAFLKVGEEYEPYPVLKLYRTGDEIVIVKTEQKENGDGVPTLKSKSDTFLVCAESKTLYDFEIDGKVVSKPQTIKFAMQLNDEDPEMISSSDVETETIEEDKGSLKEKAINAVVGWLGSLIGIPPQLTQAVIGFVGDSMRSAIQVCVDLPEEGDVSGFEVYCGAGNPLVKLDLDSNVKFLSVENPYIRSRVSGKYDISTKIEALELARSACTELSIDIAGQQTVNQDNNELADTLGSQKLVLNKLGLTTSQTNEMFWKAYNGNYGVCPKNTLKNFLPDETPREQTVETGLVNTLVCEDGFENCEITTTVEFSEIAIFDVEPLQKDVESDTNQLPSDNPACNEYVAVIDQNGEAKFVREIKGTQTEDKICFNIGACGGGVIEQLVTTATSYCITLVPVDSNGNKGQPITKCQSMKSVMDRLSSLIPGDPFGDGFIKIVTDADKSLEAIQNGDYSQVISVVGDTEIFDGVLNSSFIRGIRNSSIARSMEDAYNYLEDQEIKDDLWKVVSTSKDKAELLDNLIDADNIPDSWKQRARKEFAEHVPVEDAKKFVGEIAEDMNSLGQDAKNSIVEFVTGETASLALSAKIEALKTARDRSIDLALEIAGQHHVNLNYNDMAKLDNLPERITNELGLTDFQTEDLFTRALSGEFGDISQEALMKAALDVMPDESVERLYNNLATKVQNFDVQNIINGQMQRAREETKSFVTEQIINKIPEGSLNKVTGLLSSAQQQELLKKLFEEHGDELKSLLDNFMGGIFNEVECSDNPYDYLSEYVMKSTGVFDFFGIDLNLEERERFLRQNIGDVYGMVSDEEFSETMLTQVENMAEEQKAEMLNDVLLDAGLDPNIRLEAKQQLGEVASLRDKQTMINMMNSNFDELSDQTQSVVMTSVQQNIPVYTYTEKVTALQQANVQDRVQELSGSTSVTSLTQEQTDQLMREVSVGQHGEQAQQELLDSILASNNGALVNDVYEKVSVIPNDQMLESIYNEHINRLSDNVRSRTVERLYEQVDLSQINNQALLSKLPINTQENIIVDLMSRHDGVKNAIENALSIFT